MRKRQLLLTGALALSATIILAQTLPSSFPSKGSRRYSLGSSASGGEERVFQLQGESYRAKITQQQAMAGPDWTPSTRLPLSLARAEEIARAELRKLVPDDSGWSVTDIQLRRLPSMAHPKWYYGVGLAPALKNENLPSDSFFVLINLSGEPGLVEPEKAPR